MLLLIIILILLFGGGGGYYGYSRWGARNPRDGASNSFDSVFVRRYPLLADLLEILAGRI